MTVADLHVRGVVPKPHEAVAIVLTLFEQTQAVGGCARPDAVLPSPSAISLGSDGSVSCDAASGRLTATDIATLLQQVLEETPGVPPGLLYCMARALRLVEAPPFDSPEAFAKALSRFERGHRREVVAGLAARCEDAQAMNAPAGDRRDRRGMPRLVTHLRQELRAIDRRGYEEQAALQPRAAGALRFRRPGMVERLVALGLSASAGVAVACLLVAWWSIFAVPTPPAITLATAAPPTYGAADVTPATPAMTFDVDSRVSGEPVRLARRQRVTRKGGSGASRKPSKLRSVLTFAWLRHLVAGHNDL